MLYPLDDDCNRISNTKSLKLPTARPSIIITLARILNIHIFCLGQPQVVQQHQQQQATGEEQALNPLNAMTTALSMPMLFGDERDSILAKFNQTQSLWGAGKGYYVANQPAITFTMDNPFCRFKASMLLDIQRE